MALEIEQLQLKIESDASGASSAIDRLTATLGRLKTATSGASGLGKISSQLEKLSVSANKFSNLGSAAANIQKLQTALSGFSSMGKSNNIGSYAGQIKKFSEAANALNSMPAIQTEKINSVVKAFKQFEMLDKSALKNINGLSKIPKIVEYLSNTDMSKFAESMIKAAQAVKPLADEMQKVSEGFNVLPIKLQRIIKNFDKTSSSAKNFSVSFGGLRISLNGVLMKISALYIGATRIGSVFSSWLTESNAYTENLNLFTVAMRDTADEALQYANTVNSALGIDTSEFIRNQGIFEMITTGFGLAKEKADVMSKTLTQLGYDISSAFNIDITSSMEKIQSGISGELEPLRRLGYALDQATLQQIAYKNGINMSYNKMTQAQKSQLRYLAILEQSKNVMGDMARTILTPANSLRILDQQFTQLKRALGNMLIPMLIKVLPYIQAFVRVLTDAANAVAKTFGFELPTIDYSSLSDGATSVSESTDSITESAAKAKKELNGLAGFDKLDVLAQNTDTAGTGTGATGADPFKNIDMPTYDFLGPLDKSTDAIYKKMKAKLKDIYDKFKENKDLIFTIGKLLAGLWAVGKVAKFIKYINGIKDAFLGLSVAKTATGFLKNWSKNGLDVARNSLTKTQKALGVFAGTLMGGIASFDFFKNLEKGTMTAGTAITDLIGIGAGLAIAFATGGPIGLAIAGLGVVVGGLAAHFIEVKKKNESLRKEMMDKSFYDSTGRTIDEFGDVLDNLSSEYGKNYDLISDNTDAINSNKDAMYKASSNADILYDKLNTKGKLSTDDIDSFKDSIQSIVDLVNDNTKLDVNNIFTAIGNSASSELGKIKAEYLQLQDDIKGKLKASQDRMGSYLSSKTHTKDETAQFNKDMKYTSDMSNVDSVVQAKNFTKKLSSTNMNFENIDDFKSKMADITSNAKTLTDALEKSRQSALDSNSTMLYYAEKTYGKNSAKYKEYADSFKKSNKIINNSFDEQKNKITNSLNVFASDVQGQFVNKKNDSYNSLLSNEIWQKTGARTLEEFKKNGVGTISAWIDGVKEAKENASKEVDNNFCDYANTISDFMGAFDLKLDSSRINSQVKDYIKKGFDVPEAYQRATDNLTTATDLLQTELVDSFDPIKLNNEVISYVNQGFTVTEATLKVLEDNGGTLTTAFMNGLRSSLKNLDPEGYKLASQLVNGFTNAMPTFQEKIINAIKQPFLKGLSLSFAIESASNADLLSLGNGPVDKNKLAKALSSPFKIKAYANGGMPATGEFFMAGESGPELIGKIGNKSAVANTSQMTDVLYKAAYNGVRDAQASNNSSTTHKLIIESDDSALARALHPKLKQVDRSIGKRVTNN